MVRKPWTIIPRPVMEATLSNYAQNPRVPQPLILHGPRGVGKTTLILERLFPKWNTGPHVTAYVDFAESIKDHHPTYGHSFPWASWSTCPPPPLSTLRAQLETCLESLAWKGIKLSTISSHQIFTALNKWHGLSAALTQILSADDSVGPRTTRVPSALKLWERAVLTASARLNAEEIGGLDGEAEEGSYNRESLAALKLAKAVIRVQQKGRHNAIKHLNQTGGFSRSLANSTTDWPCLLLELLSSAAEVDYFQPKLVINNIEVLKKAVLKDDSSVSASMYHDSLIWRIIALGANERCLPIIFVTSDSYYSYRAYIDFGFPDIFISREMFGWTAAQAKIHFVDQYFDELECKLIVHLLGANIRHIFEVYALTQSNYYEKIINSGGTFQDTVEAYLAYLQITVVNPAMDEALLSLQKFASDAHSGRIPKDKLCFGAPWRNLPHTGDQDSCREWAKIQLMDFVQCLVNAYFGLNYLKDCSLEILDDPCCVALIEVGLLYVQRYLPLIRPVSRGIQRCMIRWLVQEQMEMSFKNMLQFKWQRVMRGRSYRHLLKPSK
nr:uncharacterized protein LOC109151405 [Ipomoea batatas]GME11884.1 uncharacterized protein LOC109151405 [Ipomoea batatas]